MMITALARRFAFARPEWIARVVAAFDAVMTLCIDRRMAGSATAIAGRRCRDARRLRPATMAARAAR
jgi:hypothetical protein